MELPSKQIVSQANETLDVRDALGRTLAVRRLGALDRLRLYKAIGPDLAENPPYLGMAMLAVSVMAIDGVPVPQPMTEMQVEAAVQRLGDSGIAAVADRLTGSEDGNAEGIDAGN